MRVIKEKAVTTQLDSRLCMGCGSCAESCPVHALVIHKDGDGFFRAKLNEDLCTNCGLCAKRCPALNPRLDNLEKPDCYAMMAEEKVRKISSSGGMFMVAAEHILRVGGYVCGAAFKENFEVEHIIVNSADQLYRLRGSKYMQSNSGHIYPKIKKLLEQGEHVLFTGMPCQVAGLYSFLGKDYKTLYTMDLVCHGITSSKVFDKYHEDVHLGKALTRLEFKAKEPWGWHAGVNAYFTDGTTYSKPLETDPYFIAYLQSISKNTACPECKVNRLPRQGDMTIGDFWGVALFDRTLDDNKGTSLVLLNSEKGRELFNNLKKNMAVVREAPLHIAISRNRSLEHPYGAHKNRNVFFEKLDEVSFKTLPTACVNNRIYEQIHMDLLKNEPVENHELFYLARLVASKAKGRKIVTWIQSEKFETILKKNFGLSVSFYVSQRREALVPGRIEDFSCLKDKSKEYYLVSLDRTYEDAVYKQLQVFGYTEKEDFVFRRYKPIVLENLDLSKGNYYDDYGNSIEGFNSVVGKVVFRGFNNHIMLGKGIHTARNLSFDLGANSYIDIGENTQFTGSCRVEVRGFAHTATLKIGKNCGIYNGALFRFFNVEQPVFASIGDSCTTSSEFGVHVNQGKKLIIGNDCMFSYEIELWAGDAHTIFDVKTGKNTNSRKTSYFHPNNQLVIGDHVWVGKQAFIMHGSNIGSGSIIGARSFVKGVFPNNCTIAGNPATQTKDDVAWSREGMSENINSCGPQYVNLTSHAKAPISGRKVLVIGGTRFMGIHLVKELLARGNDVTIATRGTTPDNFGLWVNRLVMDLSDADSVKRALQGKYFDVVFDNLAYCSKYVNNVLSNLKCEKYIQLSSIAAYTTRVPNMKETMFDPYTLPVELCDASAEYGKGKRQAEAIAYQWYAHVPKVTVRIPYVTKTDRLYYYCKCIAKGIPMNIEDVSRGLTFIRDIEVGRFLPWIAAQDFTGAINLASEGMITIRTILDYIEKKTGKKAILSINGSPSPFNEGTFSLNMSKAKQLGYETSDINEWFWKVMDEYIERALREK